MTARTFDVQRCANRFEVEFAAAGHKEEASTISVSRFQRLVRSKLAALFGIPLGQQKIPHAHALACVPFRQVEQEFDVCFQRLNTSFSACVRRRDRRDRDTDTHERGLPLPNVMMIARNSGQCPDAAECNDVRSTITPALKYQHTVKPVGGPQENS